MTTVVAYGVSWGDGLWRWVGTANGVTVEFVTDDPDLHLQAEAVATDKIYGVALIDGDRKVYADSLAPIPGGDRPAEEQG